MRLVRLWRWLKESWMALDLETRWPELFEGLSARQRFAVAQACASNWHEGWEPNRDDVANLIDVMREDISSDEYLHRAVVLSRRRAASA